MTRVLNRNRTGTTRALIVATLLCFAGLQVQEASHNHPADEGLAHCLLCESTADTPVAIPASSDLALPPGIHYSAVSALSAPRQCDSQVNARGPPAIS